MLGIGFAAFRDVASFFKNATQDADGTPNPLAGQITWAISRGRSQSGNFLRAFLHFGFNEDTAGRKVYDGAWPIIAGGLITLNTRFAMPDGTTEAVRGGQRGARVVGLDGPIRCAACPPRACSLAAWPPTPARRSSSTWARPKCGGSC